MRGTGGGQACASRLSLAGGGLRYRSTGRHLVRGERCSTCQALRPCSQPSDSTRLLKRPRVDCATATPSSSTLEHTSSRRTRRLAARRRSDCPATPGSRVRDDRKTRAPSYLGAFLFSHRPDSAGAAKGGRQIDGAHKARKTRACRPATRPAYVVYVSYVVNHETSVSMRVTARRVRHAGAHVAPSAQGLTRLTLRL